MGAFKRLWLPLALIACIAVCASATKITDTRASYAPKGIGVNEGTLYTVNATTLEATAVSLTAANLNNVLYGPSSGYKVVLGSNDVTGSATITAASIGLTSVVYATANLAQSAGITASCATTSVTAGSMVLKVTRPTDLTNATPVETTSPARVMWAAYGT